MVDACFSRDALVFQGLGVVKKVQLPCSADVEDVKLGIQLGGQLNGAR